MIESLLQMAEIKRCPSLEIEFLKKGEQQGQLTVEEISNWLERSDNNGMEEAVQKQKEKFLKISFERDGYRVHSRRVQNVREMLSHLETVHFRIFSIQKYLSNS